MSDRMNVMDAGCGRAEALLPDWMEGDLPAGERSWMAAHLASCDACGALVADLEAIAADARALPAVPPSRDLWEGIAARIEAPVLVLDAARPTRAPARRWWIPAAAAAALVVTTAGVTWRLATDRARAESRVAVGRDTAQPVDTGTRAPEAPVRVATTDTGTRAVAAPAPSNRESSRPAPARARPAATTQLVSRARPAAPALAPLPEAAQLVDREIASMRGVLQQRRAELDPVTVSVLERNLQVIDQAVAESRAALARDPSSGFLSEQITRTLRRKLELLRSAAAMPARTT